METPVEVNEPIPAPRCWCGNPSLEPFSPDYLRCPECGTLVARAMRGVEISQVRDDERDFYGKNYYLHHVQEENGLPDLQTRARTDLPERCLHWLRAFLKFAPAPGGALGAGGPVRTLELGCGHGGFVAMLRWAGFDATGLELSPWLTERAREWFNVPVLTARLEEQDLPEPSFDCIALMDVLEHLPDPVGTMRRAAKLLRPGGFLLVQTPGYPSEFTDDAAMRAAGHPFQEMLLPAEHLHLFSPGAARRLMTEAGLPVVRFEPAIFAGYDMFFVASAGPLPERPSSEWPALLTADAASAPAGRAVLALLDLDAQRRSLADRHVRAEADAEARLRQVETLAARLRETEADREARGEQIDRLTAWLKESEADRGARGEQIVQLTAWLKESEADRGARGEQIVQLTALCHAAQAGGGPVHQNPADA